MHLLGPVASGIIEREYCSLRPTVAFRHHGQKQENGRGSNRESDANFKGCKNFRDDMPNTIGDCSKELRKSGRGNRHILPMLTMFVQLWNGVSASTESPRSVSLARA